MNENFRPSKDTAFEASEEVEAGTVAEIPESWKEALSAAKLKYADVTRDTEARMIKSGVQFSLGSIQEKLRQMDTDGQTDTPEYQRAMSERERLSAEEQVIGNLLDQLEKS